MQVAQLTYRLFEEKDIPGMMFLWEKFSGWGEITRQQFDDWHINTPYGVCTIVVVESQEGEIVGQMVFRPTKVLIEGKEVNGLRVVAPILNNSFREADLKSSDHPTNGMFRFAFSYIASTNVEVIFFSPAIGWIPIVKTFASYGIPDTDYAIYDCIGIDVDEIYSLTSSKLDLFQVRIGKITNDYEKLWKSFVKTYSITNAISRSAEWLSWRRSNDLILEAYDSVSQDLKGVVIIKKQTGLVVEIISETVDNMNQSLKAVACWLYQNSDEYKIAEIKLMKTSFIEEMISGIPNHPVNYRFAFVRLSPQGKVLPLIKDWHIMPDE